MCCHYHPCLNRDKKNNTLSHPVLAYYFLKFSSHIMSKTLISYISCLAVNLVQNKINSKQITKACFPMAQISGPRDTVWLMLYLHNVSL
jgi:hypothetical protein